MSVDVLVVSLGTTRGLRVADAAFVDQVRRAGATAEAVAVRIGALDRLRRGYPVNDLVEAAAARRALQAALAGEPAGGGLLHHHRRDARAEPRGALRGQARLTGGAEPAGHPQQAAARARTARSRRRAARAALEPRRRGGVAGDVGAPGGPAAAGGAVRRSGGDPRAGRGGVRAGSQGEGALLLCAAWREAAIADARLAVYGIEAERARRHLSRIGPPEPEGVEWHGQAPAGEFRAALRGSTAFVHSALWEDFGQAPLEALADGALLQPCRPAAPTRRLPWPGSSTRTWWPAT